MSNRCAIPEHSADCAVWHVLATDDVCFTVEPLVVGRQNHIEVKGTLHGVKKTSIAEAYSADLA